jgi:hypothetical protein
MAMLTEYQIELLPDRKFPSSYLSLTVSFAKVNGSQAEK